MKPSIRILYLEDNPLDVALVRDLLEADGLNCTIVQAQTREGFEAALDDGPAFDLLLCDFNLPSFDGMSALGLARERLPTVPVIMLSGSLNDGQLVECLHRGATDYLLKERLERLAPAVRRALAEADERVRHQKDEKALHESEARFRQLAEHSDEVFWFVALNPERLVYVSPAIEKIWGVPAAAFYRDPRLWLNAIHPDDQARERAAYERVVAGQSARFNEEYRVVRPDGSVRWVLDTRTSIRDGASAVASIGGVARDITVRKEAEELMLRAQRLENIGMLAAGIAHDFNNALAPIIMAGSLLRQHVANTGGQRLLDTVEKSAERGAGLVRQLLSFARGASGKSQLLQARHVLKEVIELAEATFPKSIRVESHLPGDLWPVQGNVTQIHQLFLNLCVNARDAMPQGGELTVTAANATLDAAAAAGIVGARVGAFLSVEVRDTGTGIPPGVLARIWEPFFTTKAEGKGTGLGLSTVLGIAHNHGGFVTVQTRIGHGTAFTVYLPAEERAIRGGAPGSAAAPSVRGKGELILVVDDEEPIRAVTEQILNAYGYRAVTARDGADAIAVFAPRAADVRLLLSDLNMPMLGGAALAASLRRLRPDLPVIAMSGGDSGDSAACEEFATAFLSKPFQIETLLSVVRQTLDEVHESVHSIS